MKCRTRSPTDFPDNMKTEYGTHSRADLETGRLFSFPGSVSRGQENLTLVREETNQTISRRIYVTGKVPTELAIGRQAA